MIGLDSRRKSNGSWAASAGGSALADSFSGTGSAGGRSGGCSTVGAIAAGGTGEIAGSGEVAAVTTAGAASLLAGGSSAVSTPARSASEGAESDCSPSPDTSIGGAITCSGGLGCGGVAVGISGFDAGIAGGGEFTLLFGLATGAVGRASRGGGSVITAATISARPPTSDSRLPTPVSRPPPPASPGTTAFSPQRGQRSVRPARSSGTISVCPVGHLTRSGMTTESESSDGPRAGERFQSGPAASGGQRLEPRSRLAAVLPPGATHTYRAQDAQPAPQNERSRLRKAGRRDLRDKRAIDEAVALAVATAIRTVRQALNLDPDPQCANGSSPT